MIADPFAELFDLVTWILCVALAIAVYNCARARMAYVVGDQGAWGPRSLNPMTYLDPFGSFVLPALLLILGAPFVIGYGKFMRIDPSRFANRPRDDLLVFIAGSAGALGLALLATLLLGLAKLQPADPAYGFAVVLVQLVYAGAWIAVFSLLPLPGFDGGEIARILLPSPLGDIFERLRPYSWPLFLGLFCVLPAVGRVIGMDLDPVTPVFKAIASPLINGLLDLAR